MRFFRSLLMLAAAVFVLCFADSCFDRKKPRHGQLRRLPWEEVAYQEGKAAVREKKAATVNAPSIETCDYERLDNMLMELNSGRLSSIALPYDTAAYLIRGNSEYAMLKTQDEVSFRMAVRENDAALRNELSKAIRALSANGKLDELRKTRIDDASPDRVPDSVEFTHFPDERTLIFGVTGDMPPMDYIAPDGTPAGYNAALLAEIGRELKMNIKTVQVESGARQAALESKRIDVIFWVRTYGGPAEVPGMLCTDSYCRSAAACMVKDYPLDQLKRDLGL